MGQQTFQTYLHRAPLVVPELHTPGCFRVAFRNIARDRRFKPLWLATLLRPHVNPIAYTKLRAAAHRIKGVIKQHCAVELAV